MDDRVAVRANRAEISHGINNVGFADGCQWLQMVNMHVVRCCCSISELEIEATGDAIHSVVVQALPACIRISFICIDLDREPCSLDKIRIYGELFLRQPQRSDNRFNVTRCLHAPRIQDERFRVAIPK